MSRKMNLSTIKGQYTRGEEISFRFNTDDLLSHDLELLLSIYHLDSLIYQEVFHDLSGIISILIPDDSIPVGAAGFGCVCELIVNGESRGSCSTAFDFKQSDSRVIRYGFLSDFNPADSEKSGASLDFLAEFHMTHVQFYDWTYRHHKYEGPAEVYLDTMEKQIDFGFVKQEINGCRRRGMKALGYGAVYAAGEEYLKEHPEQALRNFEGVPYNLIDKFYIMDIRSGSEWRKTLMAQYRYALKGAGFDGIHMDTYGFPKRAFVSNGETRELVYLEDNFPNLINETRKVLGEDSELIFNNVGNWPVDATGPAAQDAVYIEVWEPYDHYHHIRQIILSATVHGKPVILAAYLAPFRLEDNHGGSRALNSALILHSAIISLGASHLLLGEGGKVLTQGYYNDYSELRPEERRRLKSFYDFQVRYLDVFYDPQLCEISETHTAGENREYFFDGAPVSADGRPGTVWTIVRESRKRKFISLVNLIGQEESYWNRGKQDPPRVEKILIQIPDDGGYNSVYCASPDNKDGTAEELVVENVHNERGAALQIEIEKLSIWTLVVVEYQ